MFSAYLFYHKSDSLDINSILKDNNKVDDVASTKEPLPSANPKQSSTVHPVQLPNTLIPGTNPATNPATHHKMEHRERY